MKDKKIKVIDLFAGCGGLSEGFSKNPNYQTLAAVEWEKAPCQTFLARLKTLGHEDAERRVLCFDIQRSDELFQGWSNDSEYGSNAGLDKLVEGQKVDVIIGGPPCQAYSLAGRIRDANGMRNDYRNFLFESYLKVIDRYQPDLFIFENVPGLLSAKPTGTPIVPIIQEAFRRIGYEVPENLKDVLVNMTEYGVPQNRKRLIILGLSKRKFKGCEEKVFSLFYNELLPKFKTIKIRTVKEAIGDLPALYPLPHPSSFQGKRISHKPVECEISDHFPRYHSLRDMKIFRMLASDIKSREFKFASTQALKKLYSEETGRESNIHKYYVLREDEPSNLIPAHLYKDGLRHIHPDPEQARSLTVREAARLQTFPDDFVFYGSAGDKYKMIGNAVPPKFSEILAKCIVKLIRDN